MNDTGNRSLFLESLIYVSLVGAINLIERRSFASDTLDTIYHRSLRIGEVVKYHDVIARILKLDASMAANEAAATSKHNFISHVIIIIRCFNAAKIGFFSET